MSRNNHTAFRLVLRLLFTLPVVIIFTIISFAQTDTLNAVNDTTVSAVPLISSIPDSVPHATIVGYQPTKRPWVAVGLSAALPGAGQVYNETYWKIPVIWGLGGYWIYEWVQQNKKYQDYREQYSASISTLLPNGNSQYLSLRDFYRDERDKFAWYLGVLYFANLVDAYVGANLYDFDVSPDLTADGKLVPKVTATVRVKF